MTTAASLLDEAVGAHGGLALWRSITSISGHLESGGFAFRSRFRGRALRDLAFTVSAHQPRTVLAPYPGSGRRGVFEDGGVRVESDDGRVLAERPHARAAFRGLRHRMYWDHLDMLYFAGYALWNYVTAPFVLLRPGVVAREVEPWNEEGEQWRRLEVGFPPDVPTHSREQVFYFDDAGLVRRLDYTAEPFGGWAKAAHYCREHRDFGGLVLATRRAVLPRRPSGRPLPAPTLVWTEIDDVTTS